jgi:hypothetical protein
MLIVTGAGTQEVAEFIMLSAEAIRRVMILEAEHTSDASFDAAVILFEPVGAGPSDPGSTELPLDGSRAPSVVTRCGVRPMVAFAERKNACAAFMSRLSLSIMSTRSPSRSIARYK